MTSDYWSKASWLGGRGRLYYVYFNAYAPQTPDEKELLKVCGLYHDSKNPLGVVRDHRFPMCAGFKYRVFPEVFHHPANCQWVAQWQNHEKRIADAVVKAEEVEYLFQRIEGWTGSEWPERARCLELIADYRAGKRYQPE